MDCCGLTNQTKVMAEEDTVDMEGYEKIWSVPRKCTSWEKWRKKIKVESGAPGFTCKMAIRLI